MSSLSSEKDQGQSKVYGFHRTKPSGFGTGNSGIVYFYLHVYINLLKFAPRKCLDLQIYTFSFNQIL